MPLGNYDHNYYKQIKNFTLIKETPKAVYLKLENDINLWFPKNVSKVLMLKANTPGCGRKYTKLI